MSKKFDNLSNNNRNLTGGGLQNLLRPSATVESQTAVVENDPSVSKPSASYVRHTVMFFPEDLEFLKNYVYGEKMKGKVNYSQKEALHDAILLLRSANLTVSERPEDVVEYEKQRAEFISKGKNK